MAKYRVVLEVEGSKIDTVHNAAKLAFGDKLRGVRKVDLAKSRADRLAEIAGQVDDSKSEVDSLKDELQDWYDNLPEAFQSGEKGDQLTEAINSLQELVDAMEALDFDSTEFPSMMG